MKRDGMFKTKCAGCGKEMYTFAKNLRGDLNVVYCSKICETNKKYEKRFK